MSIDSTTSSQCPVIRYRKNQEPKADILPLIKEIPLQIMVNNQPFLNTSRTPIDDELMAIGILFAEGIINTIAEISGMQLHPGMGSKKEDMSEDTLFIEVPSFSAPATPSVAAGGGGLRNQVKTQPVRWGEGLSFRKLLRLPQIMTTHQTLYARSRAAHAVAIFNREGELLTCREDVSRTHALHKALGFCLQHGIKRDSSIAVFSGRINLAMAVMISKAGFPLVLSISASTNSAVKVLEQAGITYMGSLRDDHGTLYTPQSSFIITR